MFESAEVGHRISREEYKQREPELRQALLQAQYRLLEQGNFPVIIIVDGVDGAGKGETVNLLNEWMDPRHIVTHAFGDPTDEEAQRPPMWRFWRSLPPKGRIGILFGSWYTNPIVNQVAGTAKRIALIQSIEEIRHFEQMLVTEGALVIKLWFHLSKDAQRKRLKELEKDPKTQWRVTDTDWDRFRAYDKFRKVSEYTLRETSTGDAPWHVIEGSDPHYRYLTAGTLLLEALERRLSIRQERRSSHGTPLLPSLDSRNILNTLDYSASMGKKEYESELEKLQGRLNLLTRDPRFAKKSLVVVFEGQDAAGKGGSIRRVTTALDARQFNIVPIAAPTDEERAHPYLWRFWRHLPRHNHVTIFDRSWYGRVLVERVEKFCTTADWMRAYIEINDFEEQLVRNNVIVVKFWLAITKDEQLKRFREREEVAYKNHKITPDDWRNRRKWTSYERAVCDMVERTSTEIAPWTLIPANDVEYARIMILRTLCEQVEGALRSRKKK
ncbi:MAG: polyphosphate:AMP phosphotransferase [Moraxellaceae bacterium]|jgi:polyphosphate:AMP phosphotransferase|nr:polyphosphate:AMP phosphotransferase [Moraxellaceae bacterium]MBP8852242.1 polyphosphate:AMP phosphotransferase [Moraxellaceae bacterium]MBP9046194.1 polyphosphate:AMP phosphotransferase [Moraxellaceae bacterium]MBP9731081.1 polyphosphate:AMP phosphotransferase [Moraxellaceae bacterium]